MRHLPILFGYHASNLGNSHVPLSLAAGMNQAGLRSQLYVPSADDHLKKNWLHPALGRLERKWTYRFGDKSAPRAATERLFLQRETNAPVVYLWAGLSLEVFKRCKQMGAVIVMERINCHRAEAWRRIDAFRKEQGLGQEQNRDLAGLDEENQKLMLADYIMCPSPMVYASLLVAGIDVDKLIPTTFGWSPERFPKRRAMGLGSRPKRPPRFLFVGSLCVRKGVPVLLKAWVEANLEAELVLVGAADDEIITHYGHLLEHPTIKHIPYTPNVGRWFADAEVFVFPSLEEGGPLVTYEAMAHGLLPLVSPMGAGAAVTHHRTGLVVDDIDVQSWTHALKDAATKLPMYRRIRYGALARAEQLTWDKVAQQRADLLLEKCPALRGRRAS